MSATLVNGVLIMLCETISNFIRCCDYFSIYVGLCICSYMHLVEVWITTNKHTMVCHISCRQLPWYTMLASLVNCVVFMLCEWIPDVNLRCDFSIYVAVFMGSYMVRVKLCKKTKTHTIIFSIYKTHTYNNKQYCRPWSTVSCACAMHKFPFHICVINAYVCGSVHMYMYAIIITLHFVQM